MVILWATIASSDSMSSSSFRTPALDPKSSAEWGERNNLLVHSGGGGFASKGWEGKKANTSENFYSGAIFHGIKATKGRRQTGKKRAQKSPFSLAKETQIAEMEKRFLF